MKKISILIPCYNEEENVVPISKAIVEEITNNLPQYLPFHYWTYELDMKLSLLTMIPVIIQDHY